MQGELDDFCKFDNTHSKTWLTITAIALRLEKCECISTDYYYTTIYNYVVVTLKSVAYYSRLCYKLFP